MKMMLVLAAAILAGCATNNQPAEVEAEFDGILAECYKTETVQVGGFSGELVRIYREPCEDGDTIRL